MYVISTEAVLCVINDRCEFNMAMRVFNTCHLAEFVVQVKYGVRYW